MLDPREIAEERLAGRRTIRVAIAWATILWQLGVLGLLVGVGPTGWVGGLAILGVLPLAGHTAYARLRPIELPAEAPAALQRPHPPYSPLGRLQATTRAAEELRDRGVLPAADHRLVADRVERLAGLVDAGGDAGRVGGRATPTVQAQVEALHDTVAELRAAAVDALATAPGDVDVTDRLQARLAAVRLHAEAVEEVEALRPEPGAGS